MKSHLPRRARVLAGSALFVIGASVHLLAQSTFTPFCPGTVSLCPCSNGPPQAGTGCMNSFGQGGRLVGNGNAQVTNDTVLLTASGLPTTATIIFFQGDQQVNGGNGAVFGDGLRCVEGPATWRLGVRAALGGQVSLGHGISVDPVLSVRGSVPSAGGTMHYPGWYLNAAPFCTPDGFSLTTADRVTWVP